jgi:hypothetical protein
MWWCMSSVLAPFPYDCLTIGALCVTPRLGYAVVPCITPRLGYAVAIVVSPVECSTLVGLIVICHFFNYEMYIPNQHNTGR